VDEREEEVKERAKVCECESKGKERVTVCVYVRRRESMNEEKDECAIYEGWKDGSERTTRAKGRRSAQVYRWTSSRLSRTSERTRHDRRRKIRKQSQQKHP
jgi:hypothetical protein